MQPRNPILAAAIATGLFALSALACGEAQPAAAEERFDTKTFSDPTNITNQYYPLVPGTKLVFEGQRKSIPVHVEFVVTNQTKVVNGVKAVVVSDKVFEGGQLVEDTIDWFAQDNRGNVWYLGEFASDYQGGQLKGHEGSWEAGVQGAKPGIIMPGSPRVGQVYRQEYAPRVAEDMGKVINLGDSLCVPLKCFQGNVLVTEDWTPLNTREVFHKFYAPGVGNIRAMIVKGDAEQVDLVSVERAS